MKQNYLNLILTVKLVVAAGLACNGSNGQKVESRNKDSESNTITTPVKVAEEKIRSFTFVYFKSTGGARRIGSDRDCSGTS